MPPITARPLLRSLTSRQVQTHPGPRHVHLARQHYATEAESALKSTPNSVDKRMAQQNRQTIDRQSDEQSKSGTDDAVAAQSVAFDETTDPDEVQKQSGRDNSYGNPLEASPANVSLSQETVEVKRGGGVVTTKSVTKEKTTYRDDTKTKTLEAGFEKKAFAGSTKAAKEKKLHPTVQSGSR